MSISETKEMFTWYLPSGNMTFDFSKMFSTVRSSGDKFKFLSVEISACCQKDSTNECNVLL